MTPTKISPTTTRLLLRRCLKCKKAISLGRLEALPHTKVCVRCSEEQRVKGHMITPHKTGSHIQIVNATQHSYIQSVNHRKGYGANLPTEDKRV